MARHLKTKPEYVDIDAEFTPLPKYGHLSEKHPEYAKVEDGMRKAFTLPPEIADDYPSIRQLMGNADAMIPPGGPDRDTQIVTELLHFQARDGHDIELKIYRSPTVRENATLMLRMHGGGFVIGNHEIDGAESVHAAANHNIVVASVAYRLAPEHRFPCAFNDSLDALIWCKRNAEGLGVDPERIILAGSSAGAQLAAALALEARDSGISGIVAQVLNFLPSCHPKFFPREKYEFGSYIQNKDSPIVGPLAMEATLDAYMPEPVPDQRASPLLAPSHKQLPPTLLQTSGIDIFRDEALAYAEALEEAGVDVTRHVYPGLPHCFPGYMPTLDETRVFYERYNSFLSEYSE